MKKIYFSFAVLLFVLSSCSSIYYQIGESSDTFIKANHNRSFDLVKNSSEWVVYKWGNDHPFYFYFRDGFLYQVDRGERAPDVIIQSR